MVAKINFGPLGSDVQNVCTFESGQKFSCCPNDDDIMKKQRKSSFIIFNPLNSRVNE